MYKVDRCLSTSRPNVFQHFKEGLRLHSHFSTVQHGVATILGLDFSELAGGTDDGFKCVLLI